MTTLHDELLIRLDGTVYEASTFFAHVDENLSDGSMTARECLAHLLFWHLEYVHIIEAMNAQTSYTLREGSYAELNVIAARQVPDEPMHVLAKRLLYRQHSLSKALTQLTNWHSSFAIKADARPLPLMEHLRQTEAHIRNHVVRLQKAMKRTEADGQPSTAPMTNELARRIGH